MLAVFTAFQLNFFEQHTFTYHSIKPHYFDMKAILQLTFFVTLLFGSVQLSAQVKKTTTKKKVSTVKKTIKKPVVKAKPIAVPAEVFTRVKISTDLGEIVVKLYNKTPQHRDNFIKLVGDHFYDSLLFHRVISGFMVQGGDPNSKAAPAGSRLGMGDVGYTIPAELDSTLYHKRGALCAARTDNPEKASSGCQFYIVHGRKSSDGELDNIQMQRGFTYSPAQRMTYKMNGGTPMLDKNYTVFGEVESGMEVIDSIATVAKDGNNRPIADVRMRMELVK
jgi:cyclophilin family peptidyl-prolyl cis-trans isomerase